VGTAPRSGGVEGCGEAVQASGVWDWPDDPIAGECAKFLGSVGISHWLNWAFATIADFSRWKVSTLSREGES
jgi:hypothetical protein